MSITVVLADDHAIVRDGLRSLLEAQNDLVVVGAAGDGNEALRLVQTLHPDVVVMDIAMPALNGIEATRRIQAVSPTTKVVILSMFSTAEHVYRALEAGARGYVLKESSGMEVVHAIRTAYTDGRYLSEGISEARIAEHARQHLAAAKSPLDRLSNQERRVLQQVVEGKSSAEIAKSLSLSPKTVETYRSRLMQKLGVSDLPALIRFAIQNGLTPMG